MPTKTNGWKTGTDPTLKALRAIAVGTMIGLLIWWMVVDAERDVFVGALLMGGLLASLFGLSIALPYMRAEQRRDEKDDSDDE